MELLGGSIDRFWQPRPKPQMLSRKMLEPSWAVFYLSRCRKIFEPSRSSREIFFKFQICQLGLLFVIFLKQSAHKRVLREVADCWV